MTDDKKNTCSLCLYLDTAGDWRGYIYNIISLQTARKEKNLSVPFPPSVFSSVTHARTMVGPPGEGSRHGLGEQPETPATD